MEPDQPEDPTGGAPAEAADQLADEAGDARGAFNHGVRLHQRGDLTGAMSAYELAERRGDPDGAFNLGVLLYELGDLDGAEAAWRRGLGFRHAQAAANLGFLLQQRGDLEGARAAYVDADIWGDADGARLAAALPAREDEPAEPGGLKADRRLPRWPPAQGGA